MEILVSIIRRIVRAIRNVAELMDREVFPRFVQLFVEKRTARQMSAIVLEGFVEKHKLASLNDTDLAYQIIELSRFLHDVIDIHTDESVINETVQLVCRTLDRFELKNVPEQALSFLVATRAVLLNLDECQKVTLDFTKKINFST